MITKADEGENLKTQTSMSPPGQSFSEHSPAADPFQRLQIVLNPDGSLTRNVIHPTVAATPDPNPETPVLSKDVTINQSRNIWARIFLPSDALHNPSDHKLPLLVDFHGGGFVFLSITNPMLNGHCSTIAMNTPAVVVTVEYRLAPEHRLPAAYDDAVVALQWIRKAQDEWLTNFADLSNCFLMGASAGGNIAYHAGLRAAESEIGELEPLKIRGLIMQQPFFGGVKRSGSEKRLMNNPMFPVPVSDLLWELSLPIGCDRDHEYSNPMAAGAEGYINSGLEKMKRLGWRVLVTGCDGDPLFDRQVEAAEMMAEKGIEVVRCFRKGGHHGMDVMQLQANSADIDNKTMRLTDFVQIN